MLSARLSRPFFSLSGSLPFRDCKTKIKLAFGRGLWLTDGTGSAPNCALSANTYLEAGEGVMYADTGTRTAEAGCGFFRLHGCVILGRIF